MSVTTEVAPLVRVVSVAMVTVMVLDAPAIGLLCPIAFVVKDCAFALPANSPSMSSKDKWTGRSFQDPGRSLKLRCTLLVTHSPTRLPRLRALAQPSSQRRPTFCRTPAIFGFSRARTLRSFLGPTTLNRPTVTTRE